MTGMSGVERSAAAQDINEARSFYGDSFERVVPEAGKRLWTAKELEHRLTPEQKKEMDEAFRRHLDAQWEKKYGF